MVDRAAPFLLPPTRCRPTPSLAMYSAAEKVPRPPPPFARHSPSIHRATLGAESRAVAATLEINFSVYPEKHRTVFSVTPSIECSYTRWQVRGDVSGRRKPRQPCEFDFADQATINHQARLNYRERPAGVGRALAGVSDHSANRDVVSEGIDQRTLVGPSGAVSQGTPTATRACCGPDVPGGRSWGRDRRRR